MQTKRRHEGYLVIDNRQSPGTTQSFTRAYPTKPTVAVGEGKMFEAAIITCAHCQRGVILNPQRNHTREWCAQCDHYLCDNCGLIKKIDGRCRNMNQLFDRLQEIASRCSTDTTAHTYSKELPNGSMVL